MKTKVMFSGTNSFRIKDDTDDISQLFFCNETLLSSSDSIKIECADEIKSNENVSGMRFLQKNTNAKSKLKCSECFVILTNTTDLKKHPQTVNGRKPFKCKECGKSFT